MSDYTNEEWKERLLHTPGPRPSVQHGCTEQPPDQCSGVFRCSKCHRYVGWCTGGEADEYDPDGTLCAECWDRNRTAFRGAGDDDGGCC